MNERKVVCLVTGKTHTLAPNYPKEASQEEIQAINAAAEEWYLDYLNGEVFFLSEEALDAGFRFWSSLALAERPGFKFVRELGSDILCRELRYFVNPKDSKDLRMVDNIYRGAQLPKNRKDEIVRNKNASRPIFPQKD